MSWDLPAVEALAERLAARIEQDLPGVDARSDGTFVGVLCAALAMELFDVHLFHQITSKEALPDTADDWLERHADVWGVQRVPATRAAGAVTFASLGNADVPEGTALRFGDLAFSTTEAGTIEGGGTALVAVRADAAGLSGNLASGAILTLVSPIAGLSAQTAIVAAPGLSGGAEQEEREALRARLLARIRRPPMGGRADDYSEWARSASSEIGQVRVEPLLMGLGTVGVIITMAGPRVATTPEVDLVAAYIADRRPVAAAVTVLAATLLAVPVSLALTPDTAQTRAAVTAALEAFFAAAAEIGEPLAVSRISEAVSAANGEYSHVLTAPAATVVPAAAELPVLGAVTFA